MISIHGLTKRFGDFQALAGVELEVPEGSVQGLLGPNGAGKTTTVRVLTTLLEPDAGEVTVAGHSVRTAGHLVRRNLGVSGQYAAVDDKLSGFENLTMVGELYGMRRSQAKARARELLRDFRLDDVADSKQAGSYSGGMKRRLDLAGAIVARPPVVILDEPTTGLDPRGRRDTWDAIESLATSGTTVLLTTQYLEEADQLADKIAVIDAGAIIAEGTATELKAQAGGAWIDIVIAPGSDGAAALAAARRTAQDAMLDERSRRLTARATGGSDAFRAVLHALADAQVDVAEAALRQPTLDEVFLRLTGSTATEAGAEADSEAHDDGAGDADVRDGDSRDSDGHDGERSPEPSRARRLQTTGSSERSGDAAETGATESPDGEPDKTSKVVVS
ncbi:daunorubicin resistance ABC transporter ATP-binding subunit [Sanguibacter keddieii DSM 10542]|uniref:Daunorubicin resistance ABC transporter ATP-binding subunit n=1 Tax=Sanguibacter keddieii (strain ATCC 51767 / DSM 10542 / NCFB 3025 / ST-74) TaxID=446469 RepID=D1BHC2_SANKS|nr:daunorubicin resistance protein DrrA family ABC transporter ATP-binding protein [Sanguibacter keddieii]ACZ21842.1 daunorubicin resistance ABC transporter ATP-binding subunit [Sanguibacter keddieii DSM 10542]